MDTQVVVAIIGLIGAVITALVAPIVVPAIRERIERRRRNQPASRGGVPRSSDLGVEADNRRTKRPQTGDEAYIIHTVKQGDTLFKIAQHYRTTVEVLVRTNNISDPDFLVPGDELRIPQESPPRGT